MYIYIYIYIYIYVYIYIHDKIKIQVLPTKQTNLNFFGLNLGKLPNYL